MERLTISLDDDLAGALDDLQATSGESKANVLRRALRTYMMRQHGKGRPTQRDLRIWTDLLGSREHVIMDVAHVRLLFNQLGDAPPEFWSELRQIGIEHARQYMDKGLKRVEDMLDIMESANWFIVSPEGERSWALIFTEPSAKPFVRMFLEGFYSEHPARVEIVDERTKLRVRIMPTPTRAAH